MITRNDIERDIDTSQSCATWTYKGKGCRIDPVDGHYVMWYGYGQQPDLVTKDWNTIFNTIFFDGKTLQEILPDITDYEAP